MSNDLSEGKIKSIYSEYHYNISKRKSYVKKSLLSMFSWLFLLVIISLGFDKTQNKVMVYVFWFIFFLIFAGVPILAIYYVRRAMKFDIGEKGRIVYRLLTISNLLSEFLKSDIYTKNLDKARSLNRLLNSDLHPVLSSYTYSFKLRGYSFDEKLVNFLRLLRKACTKTSKNVLEGKRDDEKLKITLNHYRKLAIMLETEELDAGIDYVKKTFNVGLDEEPKFKELLYELNKREIFRWSISFIIPIMLVAVISYVALKMELTDFSKPPLYVIVLIFFTGVSGIIGIKRFIVDKVLDSLEMKK